MLAFGKILLDSPGIQSSMSGYYHTVMRDVFVGSLCAIAVFLMSYRGYEPIDAIAGKLACAFAIGVALFPTTPDVDPNARDKVIGAMHLLFAAGFFLTLAYFSLCLFTKTDPSKQKTLRKRQRNGVYIACGCAIVACIVLIAGVMLFAGDTPLKRLDPVFWLESFAVVAFGVSWLTKGEAILKDDET